MLPQTSILPLLADARMIGFLVATRWEAAPLLRAFGFKRVSGDLYRSGYQGERLILVVSGIGMEAARRAAHRLCDAGAKELVSAGYCGALSPELQVGDVITDRIATSSRAVWSRTERLALAQMAGAQAVDMETQAVIEAGTRRGVPIRVLRVVSDRLDDNLSPLLGGDSRFSKSRVVRRLMNPRLWPAFFKLWRQSRFANRCLVQAVNLYLGNSNSRRPSQAVP